MMDKDKLDGALYEVKRWGVSVLRGVAMATAAMLAGTAVILIIPLAVLLFAVCGVFVPSATEEMWQDLKDVAK